MLEVVVDQVRRPGDRNGHAPLPELGDQVPQRLQAGVVDVGYAVGVEDHRVHRARGRRRRGGGSAGGGSRRCRTREGRRPGRPGPRGPARSGGRCRPGSSGRCPVRARGWRRGAGPSAGSGRPARGSWPRRRPARCRRGPRPARVAAASANSMRSKRKMARSSPTRNSLVAMNTRVAPRVACGRWASGRGGDQTTTRTTTAAMMLVSCERAPDAVTIAVFGGLASTANAPMSPAATLPAPTPIRSRLKSSAAGRPRRSTPGPWPRSGRCTRRPR